MTLEEAKQLKPGDRVLVEMEVMKDSFFGETVSAGAVYIRAVGMEDVAAAVKPKFIRKKLEPTTRRKFKKGDIVRSLLGLILYVVKDELNGIVVTYNYENDVTDGARMDSLGLTLICPAEDRADRKGVRYE